MMDLKEIIKWFIPCFHILLVLIKDLRLTFICLFFLFNFRDACAANVKSGLGGIEYNAKNENSLSYDKLKVNQSVVYGSNRQLEVLSSFPDVAEGRTFGRPFKKMMAALLPLVFQIGAASTWAVVAAIVGVKTLIVAVVILKILLIAGAAKIGALFGSKGHAHTQGWAPPHGWEPPHHPQKEIHLHIHNGHQGSHEDHAPVYGSWSREDATSAIETKHTAIDPYSMIGPQTIRTPFGNYVKVESNDISSNTSQ